MAKQKNNPFKKRAFQSAYTENYGRKRSQDDFYEEVEQEDFVDENSMGNPEDEKEEELKEEDED